MPVFIRRRFAPKPTKTYTIGAITVYDHVNDTTQVLALNSPILDTAFTIKLQPDAASMQASIAAFPDLTTNQYIIKLSDRTLETTSVYTIARVNYNGSAYRPGDVIPAAESDPSPNFNIHLESKGETWVLNETLDSTELAKQTINFASNGKTYTSITRQIKAPLINTLQYTGTIVYNAKTSGWVDEAYRTITFGTAPAGDLLTWLQANGVKQ